MKHCILAKFRPDAVPAAQRAPLIEEIRTLFQDAGKIPGLSSAAVYANCIARENRYDVMIVVDMEKSALPAWDASALHRTWKEQYGGLLQAKAIFDYEPAESE